MRNFSRETMQALVQAFLKDDLTIREVIAYVSAIAAIIFGGVLLWLPPAAIGSPGNVAIAFAFITGGFATLGVTITIPTANKQGFKLGYMAGVGDATMSRRDMDGGGHSIGGHGYLIVNKLNKAQHEASEVAQALRPYKGALIPGVPHARIDQISVMSDNAAGPGTGRRPEGDTVIVECSTDEAFASEQAHKTLHDLAQWVPGIVNKGTVAHFCCVSDM
jgi:hypothetical protein